MVDKKVVNPDRLGVLGGVGQHGKSDHLVVAVDGVGDPDQAARADVRLGQAQRGDGGMVGDESLLIRMDRQAQCGSPVFSGDFVDL